MFITWFQKKNWEHIFKISHKSTQNKDFFKDSEILKGTTLRENKITFKS